MKLRHILTGLIATSYLVVIHPVDAASFIISSASSSAQTLGSGSGQAGTITSSGVLTVSGSTVAVTISGSNATFTNSGQVFQTGNGRVVRDNTGVDQLTITNNKGAVMQAADADVIQMNKSPATVTLNNYGTMTSLNASAGGSQVVDFNAILAGISGGNTINNYDTGIMQASEADVVRPGVNGVVNNFGIMKSTTSTGSSSDGIDAQNNSGIVITNNATGLVEGARHGITGGAIDANATFTISITNNAGGKIQGDNGSGVNIDGFNNKELVTITNAGTITGNGVTGDGDGVDVDGLVNLNNSGTIISKNSTIASGTETSEGVTVGGGTIVNSGTIEGDVASGNTHGVGRGITLAGVDKDANGNAIPVQGIYANTTITNSGLIKGQSDSGIAVAGPATGFTVTITNQAGGTIEGGGATAAAIQTGADNDTVNNAGTIKADASNKAIDLGAGDDNLNVTGGAASIVGDVSGGTGTNTLRLSPGTGNTFNYAGAISNFNTVEAQSGETTLSGVSSYTGVTKLDAASKLTLIGANRLSSSSSLDLSGGNLKITQVGAANGQTFAHLTLEDNSVIDLDHSTTLTFGDLASYTTGKTLSIMNYDASLSPDYAIRFTGDVTQDADFLALIAATNIDGSAAQYHYDGAFTDVNANFAPVPEPSTFLFGFALVGMIGWRRRAARPAAIV